MTELTLQTEFNGEKQSIAIDPKSQLKFFFNLLRETFKKTYPLIENKKLFIFYGTPLKRLCERDVKSEITLSDLQLDNNTLLRVEIDDENYITETLLQNPHIVVAQQKELDKYAEKKSSGLAENPSEKANVEPSKTIAEESGAAKEEKKEEPIKLYGKHKLVRRIIPADNSCLFSSVNYSYYGTLGDPMVMRELISARIMTDTNLFNEAILEKTPEDYCAWILDKNSWGGGIELSIMPSILSVKIGVVSIKDLTIEYFGENYDSVIFVLYNGIHYDSVVRVTEKGDIGIFPAKDKSIEEDLIEMAKDLKTKNEFVDMKNYKIKCNVCFIPFQGNSEAIEHSKATGHSNFEQIST